MGFGLSRPKEGMWTVSYDIYIPTQGIRAIKCEQFSPVLKAVARLYQTRADWLSPIRSGAIYTNRKPIGRHSNGLLTSCSGIADLMPSEKSERDARLARSVVDSPHYVGSNIHALQVSFGVVTSFRAKQCGKQSTAVRAVHIPVSSGFGWCVFPSSFIVNR